MSEWISVEDRLPEENQLVWLAWRTDISDSPLRKYQATPFILGCGGSIWISNVVEEYIEMEVPPTHWLPIPPLPTEE